jgi:hypothetical protein
MTRLHPNGCTVEGELSVANFIDNFFKELRGKPVAGVACTPYQSLKKIFGGPHISPIYFFHPPKSACHP